MTDDILLKESYPSEALLVACFYNNPQLYHEYNDRLSVRHFGNLIWKFYFKIGQIICENGGKILDDLTVANKVSELKENSMYERFNKYETIQELIEEINRDNKKDNLEMYYEEVKKYYLLRKFRDLFGNKAIEKNGKYNYKLLNSNQIANYWVYQVEEIALENNENKFEEQFLLQGLKKEIEKQHTNPEAGMPFYKSRNLTKITNGWCPELYIFAGFGGRGKTSFTLAKNILSCVVHGEKLLVIANEESITRFRRNFLITIMGNITKEWFERQRINEGKFTIEEYQKLENAIDWVSEITEGNDKLITFIYMDDYIIEDVQKIIRHYAKLGVNKVLIDTAKPSEGKGSMQRWERMAEDMKNLYKLVRKNENLAIWCNVQLADTALSNRYLDEHSLAESKKMKNEAAVLYLMRQVWNDELEGGDYELNCFRWEKDESDKWVKREFKLDRYTDDIYYLLFTAKNRLGKSQDTGLPQLIFKVDFNKNKWKEWGYTYVINDRQYAN